MCTRARVCVRVRCVCACVRKPTAGAGASPGADLAVNSLVHHFGQRWEGADSTHSIAVLFFARVLYPDSSHEDFYKVVKMLNERCGPVGRLGPRWVVLSRLRCHAYRAVDAPPPTQEGL